MTERVVNVSAPNIVGNAVTYSDKVVTTSTPNVIANVSTPGVVTNVTTDSLNFVVSGIGEESIPNPSLFKRNQEYTILTDFPSFGFKKSFEEQVAQVDVFKVVVNYKRTFTELKTTSELFKVTIGRNLVDTSLATDTAYKVNYKVFADTFQKSDVKFIDVGKTLADTAQKSDEVRITTGKLFTETKYFTDVFNRQVDYKRTFLDFVDATDDFYGAANIDDDQVARVGKNIVDYGTASDLKTFNLSIVKADTTTTLDQRSAGVTKIFSDSYVASEQKRMELDKVFADSKSFSDIATVVSGKNALDTTVTADQKSIIASKVLLDTGYATEQTTKQVTTVQSDAANAEDLFTTQWSAIREFAETQQITSQLPTFNVQVGKFETIIVPETVFKELAKALLDTTITTDSFSTTVDFNRNFTENLATEDTKSFSANKVLSDQTTPSDISSSSVKITKLDNFASTDITYNKPGKVATEILSTSEVFTFLKYINQIYYEAITSTDSGFINNQGYFAGAYVEPGYVGTNTYFT